MRQMWDVFDKKPKILNITDANNDTENKDVIVLLFYCYWCQSTIVFNEHFLRKEKRKNHHNKNKT